jgi:hypothetical protein
MFGLKKTENPEDSKRQELRRELANTCAASLEVRTKEDNLRAAVFDVSAIVLYMTDYCIKEFTLPSGEYKIVLSETGETYHVYQI